MAAMSSASSLSSSSSYSVHFSSPRPSLAIPCISTRCPISLRASSAIVVSPPSSDASLETMPRPKAVSVSKVVPAFTEEFKYSNALQVSRVEKVEVNSGVDEASQNSKIRAGVPVGDGVTLNGEFMYSLLDRLLNLVLPRTQYFFAVNPYSFDCKGNYNGRAVFPKIKFDNMDKPRGMNLQEDYSLKVITSALVTALIVNGPYQSQQAFAENISASMCQIAVVPTDAGLIFDTPSDGGVPFVMGGMTAKNFNPARYAGRWFEVASLKRGFAGQGQEDCHCTQGVYTFDEKNKAIQVDTFCAHGSPDGYITGIRGVVRCVDDVDISTAETEEERQEMIASKCYLKFPFLPFIPKEPYDVIDTDYDTFALVSGAKDKSFVQIYSRTPNPGPEFIDKYKNYLGSIGFNAKQIKDTPQDCQETSMGQLQEMMTMPGMKEALINRFPDLELRRPVQLNPFTSVFDTFRKLLELYFK